ncbi:MAG: hypothetical protein JW991_02175 [Candidatus Pacebacteria bacterium]|nr:hypothetical protein [Candidatus Paceibacterota bacterium]
MPVEKKGGSPPNPKEPAFSLTQNGATVDLAQAVVQTPVDWERVVQQARKGPFLHNLESCHFPGALAEVWLRLALQNYDKANPGICQIDPIPPGTRTTNFVFCNRRGNLLARSLKTGLDEAEYDLVCLAEPGDFGEQTLLVWEVKLINPQSHLSDRMPDEKKRPASFFNPGRIRRYLEPMEEYAGEAGIENLALAVILPPGLFSPDKRTQIAFAQKGGIILKFPVTYKEFKSMCSLHRPL